MVHEAQLQAALDDVLEARAAAEDAGVDRDPLDGPGGPDSQPLSNAQQALLEDYRAKVAVYEELRAADEDDSAWREARERTGEIVLP